MKIAKTLPLYGFLLSILMHLILFLGFTVSLVLPVKQYEEQKTPSLDIPAYVYQEHTPTVLQQDPAPEKSQPVSKYGIMKSAKKRIKNLTQLLPMNLSKPDEPVHMIGEDKVEKPLLTLLGKALTKHLFYPRAAMEFNVRGTAIIGFVLYPDGQVSDVQLIKTSGAGILDDRALTAAKAIAPVNKVNLYLKQPQFFVIGIVFG